MWTYMILIGLLTIDDLGPLDDVLSRYIWVAINRLCIVKFLVSIDTIFRAKAVASPYRERAHGIPM